MAPTIELSIICTLPSCALTMASIRRSQTPELAPAVEVIVGARVGPYRSGRSRDGAPVRNTQKIPLRTRRLFARLAAATVLGQKRFDNAPLEIGQAVAHDPSSD